MCVSIFFYKRGDGIMARYYWNIASLRKELDKLRKMAEREKDLEKKAAIEYAYDVANNDIFNSYVAPERNISRSAKMVSNYSSFLADQRFFYLIEPFTNAFEDNLRLYNTTMNNLNIVDTAIERAASVHVGREQAISICRDFYRDLDEEFYQCFLPFYNKRFNHLQFVKKINEYGGTVTRGNQFFIYGVNESFVNILGTDNPSMIITLIHEAAHVVDNNFKPEAVLYDTYFTEVISLFMELAALDAKVGNFKNVFYYNYLMDRINTMYNYANDTVEYDLLMGFYKRNEYTLDKGFYQLAREEEGISKERANTLLFEDGYSDMVYPICVSLALYFYNIYRSDKRKGLEELKKFLNTLDRDKYIPLMRSKELGQVVSGELNNLFRTANTVFCREQQTLRKKV
jgi:hypothetical protein